MGRGAFSWFDNGVKEKKKKMLWGGTSHFGGKGKLNPRGKVLKKKRVSPFPPPLKKKRKKTAQINFRLKDNHKSKTLKGDGLPDLVPIRGKVKGDFLN